MVTIKLICVGKIRDKNIEALVKEYAKRLSAYCRFELLEAPEQLVKGDGSIAAETRSALQKEGEDILRLLPKRGVTVALCVEGAQKSSEELSAFLEKAALEGDSTVSFLIGSSYGLSDTVKARADVKLSVSKMTFPHGLMRVILLEQLFRAFKISRGETYHK